MEEADDIKTWSKNYIKKRPRQWARLARAFRRQAGRGQPAIIAAFAALGAAAAASRSATAGNASGTGGDSNGTRTAGRQIRQRIATGGGGPRKRRAAAPMAPRAQQRDVRARQGGGGGQAAAGGTPATVATAAGEQAAPQAAAAAVAGEEQGAQAQVGHPPTASGTASAGASASGPKMQATLTNWRKRTRDEEEDCNDGATADRRPALILARTGRASGRTHLLAQEQQRWHAALTCRRRGEGGEGPEGGPWVGPEAEAGSQRAEAERQVGRRRAAGWAAGCAAGCVGTVLRDGRQATAGSVTRVEPQGSRPTTDHRSLLTH